MEELWEGWIFDGGREVLNLQMRVETLKKALKQVPFSRGKFFAKRLSVVWPPPPKKKFWSVCFLLVPPSLEGESVRSTTTTTSYYCTGLVGVGGGAWRPISWVDPHPNQAQPGRKSRRRGGRGWVVEKKSFFCRRRSSHPVYHGGGRWFWCSKGFSEQKCLKVEMR